MNATDVAAWWGALAASAAVAWDIVKWTRRGPRIEVDVTANIILVGGNPLLKDDKKYIRVIATNMGDQKTTITNLAGEFYTSAWKKRRKHSDSLFIVAVPAYAPPLPFGLSPGEQWSGSIIQTPELEEQAKKGILLVGIYHAASKKAVLQQVKILSQKK